MNNAEFRSSFFFTQYTYQHYRHNNVSHGAVSYYLGYLHEGHGRLQSRELTLVVEPGDLFYIPKGCVYHSYWHSDNRICYDSFGFHYFPFPDNTAFPLQTIRMTDSLLEKLQRLSAHKVVCGQTVGLLYQLLDEAIPTMITTDKPKRNHLVERAVARMQVHPHATVAEIAQKCGVSKSGLYSAFRQVYGKSPVVVRQELLVQQAIGLLTTTDQTVEAISDQLGFCTPAYFRKIFKEHTGLSPRQARKNQTML